MQTKNLICKLNYFSDYNNMSIWCVNNIDQIFQIKITNISWDYKVWTWILLKSNDIFTLQRTT